MAAANRLGYRISWHYDADADSDVDANDPWYHFVYDDRWRPVATYRGTDSDPKEHFIYHNAGANGLGGSSYIDSIVLRDADDQSDWLSAGDGTLEERNYYCQNWRADVSVIVGTDATPIEWIKYSAYGVPSSYALADFDHDGDVDNADITAYFAAQGGSGPGWTDVNFDGDSGTGGDDDAFSAAYNDASTGGVGVLSRGKTGNRVGFISHEMLAAELWAARSAIRKEGVRLSRWSPIPTAIGLSGPRSFPARALGLNGNFQGAGSTIMAELNLQPLFSLCTCSRCGSISEVPGTKQWRFSNCDDLYQTPTIIRDIWDSRLQQKLFTWCGDDDALFNFNYNCRWCPRKICEWQLFRQIVPGGEVTFVFYEGRCRVEVTVEVEIIVNRGTCKNQDEIQPMIPDVGPAPELER